MFFTNALTLCAESVVNGAIFVWTLVYWMHVLLYTIFICLWMGTVAHNTYEGLLYRPRYKPHPMESWGVNRGFVLGLQVYVLQTVSMWVWTFLTTRSDWIHAQNPFQVAARGAIFFIVLWRPMDNRGAVEN